VLGIYQSIHILTNVIVSLQNDDIGEDVNRLVELHAK
jgi:hypothetical protein